MRYLVIVIALILGNHAFAQSNGAWVRNPSNQHDNSDTTTFQKKLIILTAGPSVPMGNFAAPNTDGAYAPAGYAKKGYALDLSLRTPVLNSFSGLVVSLGYQSNPLNAYPYYSNLIETKTGSKGPPHEFIINSYNQPDYNLYNAMIGWDDIHVVNRFFFEAILQAGIVYFITPAMSYNYTMTIYPPSPIPPSTYTVQGYSPSDASLGLFVKAALRFSFSVTSRIFLTTEGDIYLGKASFSFSNEILSINSFRYSIGIGLKL